MHNKTDCDTGALLRFAGQTIRLAGLQAGARVACSTRPRYAFALPCGPNVVTQRGAGALTNQNWPAPQLTPPHQQHHGRFIATQSVCCHADVGGRGGELNPAVYA